jgi:hypothetical protein
MFRGFTTFTNVHNVHPQAAHHGPSLLQTGKTLQSPAAKMKNIYGGIGGDGRIPLAANAISDGIYYRPNG